MGSKRQIPKHIEITADKEYNDLVYGFLQTLANDLRLIPKNKMKATLIARATGISRQTVSRRLQYLFDMEFVYDRGDYCEMAELPENMASLIPIETIQILVDTLNEKTISVYVYLFNRFWAADQKEFDVTYAQIKGWIGIATGTRSNDQVVKNILTILKQLGLVECEMVSGADETAFSNVKTWYRVKQVNLYLPNAEKC